MPVEKDRLILRGTDRAELAKTTARRTLIRAITGQGKSYGLWKYVLKRLLRGDVVHVVDILEQSGEEERRILVRTLDREYPDKADDCLARLTYSAISEFAELREVSEQIKKHNELARTRPELNIPRIDFVGVDALHYIVELARMHIRRRYLDEGGYYNNKDVFVKIKEAEELWDIKGFDYGKPNREVLEFFHRLLQAQCDIVATLDPSHPTVEKYLKVGGKFGTDVELTSITTDKGHVWKYRISKFRGDPIPEDEYMFRELPEGMNVMDVVEELHNREV